MPSRVTGDSLQGFRRPVPPNTELRFWNNDVTENLLGSMHAQTLFFSVAGVNDATMYNQNLLLVQAERKMFEQAQQIVLLCDSSKFGQQALAKLGRLDEVEVVVADVALAPEFRDEVKRAGCELMIAE